LTITSCFINLDKSAGNQIERIANSSSFVILISFLLYIPFTVLLISRNIKKLKNTEFKLKFGPLIEGLRL